MDAVLPLVGVVIGAVLGGGMTFLLDRRRERRAASAALRLVVFELRSTRSTWVFLAKESVEATAEATDWLISQLQKRPFATTQWTTHQEVLASLPEEKWKVLANAYAVIGLVNEIARADLNPNERSQLPEQLSKNLPYLDQAVQLVPRGPGAPIEPFDTAI